jgi:hypothetical protein
MGPAPYSASRVLVQALPQHRAAALGLTVASCQFNDLTLQVNKAAVVLQFIR